MHKRYTFKRNLLIGISRFLVVILVLFSANLGPWVAHASSLSSVSDNLSRLAVSTLSSHTIQFVTPTGIGASTTVIFTFGTGFTVGALTLANYKFLTGSAATCSGSTFTPVTLINSAPDTSHWGISSTGNVVTLSGQTSGITSTVGKCVRLVMGNDAANDNPGGSPFVTNSATPADPNATVSITGTFGDVGSVFVPFLANDQVTLSATVNPTLSFTLSQTALGFGTLTTANGRWATNGGGAAVATTGLVLTASTNGASGYTIYVVGPTLTNVANPSTTIAAMGASATSAPGTAQFGLNGAVGSGTGTISSPYATASQYAYTATTTQTPVATNTVPDPGTTYNISYLANITAVTPAGAYTAVHTWTATANF